MLGAIEATPRGSSTVEAVLRAYVGFHADALHLFRATYVHSQTVEMDPDRIDATINAERKKRKVRFSVQKLVRRP